MWVGGIYRRYIFRSSKGDVNIKKKKQFTFTESRKMPPIIVYEAFWLLNLKLKLNHMRYLNLDLLGLLVEFPSQGFVLSDDP